jgi:hypothetical protein
MKSDLHKFLDLASPAELEILWRRSPEALRPRDLIRLKDFIHAREMMGGGGCSQQLVSLRDVRVDGRPVKPGFDPQEGAVFYGLNRHLKQQLRDEPLRAAARQRMMRRSSERRSA